MIPSPPLLLIGDRAAASRGLAAVFAAAIDGGCRWLMVREKDFDTGSLTALAGTVAAMARRAGAAVLVNGDAEAARAAGAAGVHLPRGGSVAAARGVVGPGALVGVSAHSEAEAAAAARDGADYVTLSPVFATASKPGYGPPLGLVALHDIAQCTRVPVIALAGITPGNAGACLAAGAAGVAVMGSVMRAGDPRRAVVALLAAMAAREVSSPVPQDA